MKRNRLLLLLALLMTAATGAWAQDAKHRITATLNSSSQTQPKTLDVTLPYETTIGEVYTAVTGKAPALYLSLTAAEVTSGTNVSIGAFNEWNTPVTVSADGDATVEFTATLMGASSTNGTITLSVAPVYAVKLADGTQDAKNWTATVGQVADQELPADVFRGDAVTLTYGGRLKVKSVTATHDGWNGDLSNIPASALESDGQTLIVPNGATLKGTLDVSTIPYKVVIPDGATVKLDGVSINGVNNANYMWAGITCLGDATIILSGTNTVKGFFKDYPGIQAAAGKTLIINGTGSLTASSYGLGAGIGGKRDVACGDIEIQGGTITATSGSRGAGIGGGDNASCGNITISGGTVNATGGVRGAGIGGGRRGQDNGSCGNILISGGTVTATGGAGAAGIGGGRCYNTDKLSSCGTITITTGVTKVTATKGENAPYSIGAGYGGTCGTVTIGGTLYWQADAAVDNDAATYLGQATIVYPEPGPLATPLTMEAITAGSITVANPKPGMQYSLDGGKTKNAVTTDAIDVAAGDKVQFYGKGTNIIGYGSNAMSECTMINGSGEGFTCKVYGNIMSLLDEENFASATTLSASYTFKSLFYNNPTLTDASGLLLPATQLQESCYRSMFSGCEALTAAPALPAMQLAAHCYREMFNGCSVLTAAPVLPATKLVMYCYFAMFNYCEKLATVTCLATSGINQDSSTYYWLYGAGSQFEGTKTVNTFSTADWPTYDDSGIPTGWTRVKIDN